jgi:hypothetical protein
MYYRLPVAERESLTRDQDTWRGFERRLLKANHEAFKSAIADMDKGGGTKEEQFARLASLMKERSDPRQFNVEKGWHAVAYLLTGQSETGWEHRDGETLHNVIYGGLDTAVTNGYGAVRYFNGALVAESAGALAKADRQIISQRFDPARMVQLGIYAAPDEREREGVLRFIEKLAAFFQTADAAKEDVIKFAS